MAIWRRNQISDREDDAAENAEVNMWAYRYGKISHIPAAFQSQSCNTMAVHQLGRACFLLVRNARYNAQLEKKEVKWGTGSRMAG